MWPGMDFLYLQQLDRWRNGCYVCFHAKIHSTEVKISVGKNSVFSFFLYFFQATATLSRQKFGYGLDCCKCVYILCPCGCVKVQRHLCWCRCSIVVDSVVFMNTNQCLLDPLLPFAFRW